MNTDEKSLVEVKEKSIFHRIKSFIKKLFTRNKMIENVQEVNYIDNVEENKKQDFMNYIKNIENDETRLNELQRQYMEGKIKEEDLSEEQVNELCELYDRQINNLRKANEIKLQKLLEYRRKLQTEN